MPKNNSVDLKFLVLIQSNVENLNLPLKIPENYSALAKNRALVIISTEISARELLAQNQFEWE